MAGSTVKVPNHRRNRSYFKEPDFKIGSRHRDFTPDKVPFNPQIDGRQDVNCMAVKLKFLTGEKDVVMY